MTAGTPEGVRRGQLRDAAPDASEASTGDLVSRLAQQTTELVRGELQLAKAEMTAKARYAGIGGGLFGAAGLVALYGIGALVTAAILGLATALDPWLSALVVGVVLLVVAGIVALVGRGKVRRATPAAPERTIDSLKQDVDAVKNGGAS